MKIQYASDLHLEFHDNSRFLKESPLIPVGDILILAGDIGYLNDDNYSKHPFWDWASENFKQVIVAVGNHELYKYYDLAKMPHGLVYSIRENVKCYYNDVISIEDTDIIVSTLWAKIPLEEAYLTERGVTDFHRILFNGEILTFADFNREHDNCFRFIRNEVAKSTAKHIIVVTHHVPSFQLTSPDFAGSKINGAFTVELKEYIESSPIEYWIYGHSHRNIDKQIGNACCVSNQLGYVSHNEHLTFDPQKMIIING
ncbi:putative phosphodiesterase [Parabacteroides sp. PF5-5]|uniref:metallophosphoesterase n=1 Tax=unclassified Parabacteroides TaxID=2649774 RepID=UPI0024733798|nr:MULTISPECIES: metallophosphoesterase [unclassified Parabacteroides]MDH6305900.1 putative phosphodiesterase [Parabacteroides sp. PH5-39]MDH6317287.1 putative phosphodiesterase [Parabacteroides sp. PF5-13]MDH6320495.1 putative phosphodiesterase [Parabacteroides sp. PH5-13]MDH6324343.1 putative phosphodiesterase [Parabacteroides sp. PH5-8]MDH6328539.1 putative phosphodiesterase [Parabacteroides sp. PH5-41]